MKILHISDLHLGRQFCGISLEEDHQAVLNQVMHVVETRSPHALIISGDIFDRATPPSGAVRQFNNFLNRLARESATAVIMIAGNHDSGDRIDAMATMPDAQRVLIRGTPSVDEVPITLRDEYGIVAFSALPFSYEYAARACYEDEDISSPEDVLRVQISAAQKALPLQSRWVIVAHAFVSGASGSESERPLVRVGGIETVSTKVFEGAHYVALGHLHRPQSVDEPHIWYAGSPLAFSFDEADHTKSMNYVVMDAVGGASVEQIPFQPLRGVGILKGKLTDILVAAPTDKFLKVILTDETAVVDPMRQIRAVFPNACQLTYSRDETKRGWEFFNLLANENEFSYRGRRSVPRMCTRI